MKVLSFLLRYSKGTVMLAIVAGIISGASSTGLLALINAKLTGEDTTAGVLLWGFIGLCVLVPVTRVASELMLTHLGQSTLYDLRMQISRRILSVPLPHLEKLGPPRLLATLTDDIPAISGTVTQLPVLCINLAILLGGLVYMGWLSMTVLLLVIGLIVVGVLSYQLPVARAMAHFRTAWQERDRLYDHFRALTEGTKELKLHGARRKVFLGEVLHGTATSFRGANIRAQTIYTIASSWGQLLVFLIIGLVLFSSEWLPFVTTDASTLTGFTLVLLYLMTPLQVLLNSLPNLGRAEVALRRVEDVGLNLAEHSSDDPEMVHPPLPSWRSLELRGVTHTYRREGEDRDFQLGPIDLEMKPGELVFLAGGNGSGKTTLAKLLVGLYPPEEGEILFDGEPVTAEGMEAYRQNFSVIFSDFYLFESLIGLEQPDLDEKARTYLERLQLQNKLEITDGRLSTTALSQGQRKRLALLTAFLEDRPIYVFDEWAADQDPVFRDIFYLQILPELKRRGKGVLVISHDDRYYTMADRLIKLEYGKIVHKSSGIPEIVPVETTA